jgi:hypothetical protein
MTNRRHPNKAIFFYNLDHASDDLQIVAAPTPHIRAKKMTNSGNPFRPQIGSRMATFDPISTGHSGPKPQSALSEAQCAKHDARP